jgi:hypothetical protein
MGRKIRKLYVEYFEAFMRNAYAAMKNGEPMSGYYDRDGNTQHASLTNGMKEELKRMVECLDEWCSDGRQVLIFDHDAESAIGETDGLSQFTEQELCDCFPYDTAYIQFDKDEMYDGAFVGKVDDSLRFCACVRLKKVSEKVGKSCGVEKEGDFDNHPFPAYYLRNLCIYAAAVNADINVVYRPPKDKRILKNRKKRRSAATVTEVGYRIGSSLREYERSAYNGVGNGGAVRPHVRRAHWHRFWTGPMGGDRKLVTKWLHPCLVGVGEVQTTLHKVI